MNSLVEKIKLNWTNHLWAIGLITPLFVWLFGLISFNMMSLSFIVIIAALLITRRTTVLKQIKNTNTNAWQRAKHNWGALLVVFIGYILLNIKPLDYDLSAVAISIPLGYLLFLLYQKNSHKAQLIGFGLIGATLIPKIIPHVHYYFGLNLNQLFYFTCIYIGYFAIVNHTYHEMVIKDNTNARIWKLLRVFCMAVSVVIFTFFAYSVNQFETNIYNIQKSIQNESK